MTNPTTDVVDVPVAKTRGFSGAASLVAYCSGAPTDPAAPALVFLHAGVCDSRMWAGQFERFAATHRVVAWDRRGFGATAAADEHFSSVDDLFAVLDTLHVERAVLVGCSQGGRTALDGPKLGSTDTPDTAWARLADVAVPTLIVWGLLDVPSVVINMRHAAATIPGARTLVLDDVAHLPNLEGPDRFDAALSAFLHDAVR